MACLLRPALEYGLFGFHLDEHVPRAVADALRRRGIDVLTTSDAGMLGMSDTEHLAHALAAGLVLVTQDSDFLRLHEQRHNSGGSVAVRRRREFPYVGGFEG